MSEADFIVEGETGLQRTLGYINHVYADRTETRMVIDERHTNRHGGLHGGLFSVLLDSALGFAASRAWSQKGDQLIVTVSLTTNYLAPAREGEVMATGRVDRAGGSVAFASGDVRDSEGNILATGSGVFKRLGKSTPRAG